MALSLILLLQEFSLSRHNKYFIGDGLTNLLRRALPPEMADDDATVTRYVAFVGEEYNKRWSNKTRPFPGIPELLQGLKNKGLRTAVFANKPDSAAQKVIRHFFPDLGFEIVQGAMPSRPIKPDPTGALAIAKEMGLLPNQFLYLGDTGTDMRIANAAGMYPVGVLWEFRTGAELFQNGAKLLLEKPAQLFDYKII